MCAEADGRVECWTLATKVYRDDKGIYAVELMFN